MRKPVIGVSDQVGHRWAVLNSRRLEAYNFRFRKKRNCTLYLVKIKALISCVMVTEQLIVAFVFTDAKSGFSHDTAHILSAPECFENTCKHTVIRH